MVTELAEEILPYFTFSFLFFRPFFIYRDCYSIVTLPLLAFFLCTLSSPSRHSTPMSTPRLLIFQKIKEEKEI
jgi:hypothetical protein